MNQINGRNKTEQVFIDEISQNNPNIFYFWNELNDAEKDELINSLHSVNLSQTTKNYEKYVLSTETNNDISFEATQYFSYHNRSNNFDMIDIGKQALQNGEVAFLTVAGGQASRLDYDYPKGCYPISPINRKPLFQIFAEKIKFYSEKYKNKMYWYIMTSDTNYNDTVDFFTKNNFWELERNHVIFFKQGMLATITNKGKLILADKNHICRNPDGHGGILTALLKTGTLQNIADKKIKYLSYFQVDNPLINMADPFFIGYHIKNQNQVSTKVIEKLYPEEKIGVIGKKNGKNGVIEYSDISKEMESEKTQDGKLKYGLGSIGIHIFNVDFLLNFTDKLPIHVAHKKIHGYSHFDSTPSIDEIDCIKFETFVFDTIELANKSGFFETSRQQEFFPLKNKSGLDSIATCTKGQINAYISWLVYAGVLNDDQVYKINKVEVSPLFAPDKETFVEQVALHKKHVLDSIYKDNLVLDTIYIDKA